MVRDHGLASGAAVATLADFDKAFDLLFGHEGESHASRLYFMAGLQSWSNFGRGWSRRLARRAAASRAPLAHC